MHGSLTLSDSYYSLIIIKVGYPGPNLCHEIWFKFQKTIYILNKMIFWMPLLNFIKNLDCLFPLQKLSKTLEYLSNYNIGIKIV